MLDKKVTRKEFLLSGLSIITLLAVSKYLVPSVITKKLTPTLSRAKGNNAYGNYAYGGKSNA